MLQGAYGVFWFITVLWISTNLFNWIIQFNGRAWLLLILIVIGYLFGLISIPLPWNIQVVPMAMSYIWIGFILKRFQLSELINMKKYFWLLSLVIVVFLWTLIWTFRQELAIDMKYNDFGIPLLSLINSVVASISVAVIAVLISKVDILAKIISVIGGASMIIMYLHLPIRQLFLSRLHLESNHVIAIVSGISVPMVIYAVFRQNRITRKYFLGESN